MIEIEAEDYKAEYPSTTDAEIAEFKRDSLEIEMKKFSAIKYYSYSFTEDGNLVLIDTFGGDFEGTEFFDFTYMAENSDYPYGDAEVPYDGQIRYVNFGYDAFYYGHGLDVEFWYFNGAEFERVRYYSSGKNITVNGNKISAVDYDSETDEEYPFSAEFTLLDDVDSFGNQVLQIDFTSPEDLEGKSAICLFSGEKKTYTRIEE